MTVFIDLSHVLEPGMPAYPGIPAMQFSTLLTHEESPSSGRYAAGTTFQIAKYEIAGNTGTYLDAPFHRHPQGQDLADVALEQVANITGVVVTALREGALGPEVFQGLDLRGQAVLIRTDWSKRWGGPDYFRSGPFLTSEACRLLVREGVAIVGIDCANIDDMMDQTRPAHTMLLAAGIPIVEHLRALEHIPARPFKFFAVPPAVKTGTSFPVRAFVMYE